MSDLSRVVASLARETPPPSRSPSQSATGSPAANLADTVDDGRVSLDTGDRAKAIGWELRRMNAVSNTCNILFKLCFAIPAQH